MGVFSAYYASDPGGVDRFCRENGINHLIVDLRHFDRAFLSRGLFYFKPFNEPVKGFVAGKRRFVLAEVPDADKLYDEDGIFVVSCRIFAPKM